MSEPDRPAAPDADATWLLAALADPATGGKVCEWRAGPEEIARLRAIAARLRSLVARVAEAEGAMQAQDENLRRQLAAHGLADRYHSLTHLADEMGEDLLKVEAELHALHERAEAAEQRVAALTEALEIIGKPHPNDWIALNRLRRARCGHWPPQQTCVECQEDEKRLNWLNGFLKGFNTLAALSPEVPAPPAGPAQETP